MYCRDEPLSQSVNSVVISKISCKQAELITNSIAQFQQATSALDLSDLICCKYGELTHALCDWYVVKENNEHVFIWFCTCV